MRVTTLLGRCAGLMLLLSYAGAAAAEPPKTEKSTREDPKALAAQIGKEVSALRGLPFKRTVGVEMQSQEQLGKYLDQALDKSVPPELMRHYGKVVRTLGLYRGPEITDFRGAMKRVLSSQAGAYYDPRTGRFYVLFGDMQEMLEGALYAHELYHGLQDQHFGLEPYMGAVTRRDSASFDGDQALARQAVVEGEATYVMTLWTFQRTMGKLPPRDALSMAIAMQSNMSVNQLQGMLAQPQTAAVLDAQTRESIEATKTIPPFIMETLLGAYLKGVGFIFAVHEKGWPEVEKLYREYPPQSTEQILHPEKWTAREGPSKITWPDFASVPVLKKDWQLIDSDVLGELQWRIIFREHGLTNQANSAAAGWDGDRYAVFKRKDSDAMLLLLRTSWDDAAQAKEFNDAYGRLLQTKYSGVTRRPWAMVQRERDVYVVEGARSDDEYTALLDVIGKASKQKLPVRK